LVEWFQKWPLEGANGESEKFHLLTAQHEMSSFDGTQNSYILRPFDGQIVTLTSKPTP
jgi:hypothetical protein